MKLVIYGGRNFHDFDLLCEEADKVRSVTAVICGEAPGADRLGRQWAELRGIPVISRPADWDGEGKTAGKKRNVTMAKECHMGLGFWDGRSPGTKHMNGQMKKFNKPHRVVKFVEDKFQEFNEKEASGGLDALFGD